MLRTATVNGWQPQSGVLINACLATLLKILMTGMLVPGGREQCVCLLLGDTLVGKFQ